MLWNNDQPGMSTATAPGCTPIYPQLIAASEDGNNWTPIKPSDLGAYASCRIPVQPRIHKWKQMYDPTDSMMMMNLNENENQQMPDQVVNILWRDTNSPTITVRVNVYDTRAILDTGASATILKQQTFSTNI